MLPSSVPHFMVLAEWAPQLCQLGLGEENVQNFKQHFSVLIMLMVQRDNTEEGCNFNWRNYVFQQ
jgi:hypothetical protein